MMASMGRWKPNPRGRLVAAALELYSDRGFEQTTVADIAQRAGLTERTFFRHFADKREVLFAGGDELQAGLLRALEQAPASLSIIDAVGKAMESVGVLISVPRDFARRRLKIIAANPELQERERVKLASIAAAFADALERRGAKRTAAMIAAEMGVAVFRIAFERWVGEKNKRDLAELVRESFNEMKTVIGHS